jgi:hypothetical protein
MTEKTHHDPAQKTTEHDVRVKDLSRRGFLNSAGCAAMGGLVVAAGGHLLTEKKAIATPAPEAPPLPWKYTKLDPMEAGKRGYENYLLRGG